MNPDLENGDRNEWVEYLQKHLVNQGYDTGPVDGWFGPITQGAVEQFQRDNGLEADGKVGAATWSALEGDGGTSESTEIAINQSLTLVAQPTEVTCWAASIAMLVGKTVEEVCDEAGMTMDDGYGWTDIQHAVSVHGLTEIGPACGGPDYFADMLQSSPLWIVEVGAPYHAVVLAGLNGGGQWDDTEATVYNPWPPGSGAIETLPFARFAEEYELGSGANAQIVSR
jgi:peptidoglycan hydrolase-like protein with peptidoglycan-binding domain